MNRRAREVRARKSHLDSVWAALRANKDSWDGTQGRGWCLRGQMRRPFGQFTPHPDPPPQGGREKDKGTGMLSEAFFEGGYEIGQRDPDLGHLVA